MSHDTAARRFSAEVDGQRAVLDYTLVDDVMTITHTRVPAAIGGRGIAAELMRAALRDWPRSRSWKVVPACSYAAAYYAPSTAMATPSTMTLPRRHQEEVIG